MKQSKPEDFLTQRTQSLSAKDASSNKSINKIYPDYFALIFPLFSAAPNRFASLGVTAIGSDGG
jgi:hypothetical protein